jgi:hypothetical protein
LAIGSQSCTSQPTNSACVTARGERTTYICTRLPHLRLDPDGLERRAVALDADRAALEEGA